MPRTVHAAAIQMDARTAPTADRLARAGALVAAAAAAGAQLVLLPELFGVGYEYTAHNYGRAETMDGPTAAWMRDTAHRLGIHLAGSLLLLDGHQVYNALLLWAPDGRVWRYDKRYPCGWERAYFCAGQGVTVADTDLGRIGLLICWDVAHPALWRAYAGQVDGMLVCSCPPDMGRGVWRLPGGQQLDMAELGPAFRPLWHTIDRVFGTLIDEQAAWLGAPAVASVGCGQITTPIPGAAWCALAMAPLAPAMLPAVGQAEQIRLSCAFAEGCKIVAADGRVVARRSQAQGEGFVSAPLEWPAMRRSVHGPPPATQVSPLAYLSLDGILPWLSALTYRRGVRRAWGPHMAPLNRTAAAGLLLLAAVALFAAAFWRRRTTSRQHPSSRLE